MCLATEGGHHWAPHPKHGSRRTLWNLLWFFFISREVARAIQSCPKSSIKFKFNSTLLLHNETSRPGINPGNQIMKVSQGWAHPQHGGTSLLLKQWALAVSWSYAVPGVLGSIEGEVHSCILSPLAPKLAPASFPRTLALQSLNMQSEAGQSLAERETSTHPFNMCPSSPATMSSPQMTGRLTYLQYWVLSSTTLRHFYIEYDFLYQSLKSLHD